MLVDQTLAARPSHVDGYAAQEALDESLKRLTRKIEVEALTPPTPSDLQHLPEWLRPRPDDMTDDVARQRARRSGRMSNKSATIAPRWGSQGTVHR